VQASITVDVDVPFPFSATPKPALEATGNAAFDTTLKLMLDGKLAWLLVLCLPQVFQTWAAMILSIFIQFAANFINVFAGYMKNLLADYAMWAADPQKYKVEEHAPVA
jgi:hypothetical protein